MSRSSLLRMAIAGVAVAGGVGLGLVGATAANAAPGDPLPPTAVGAGVCNLNAGTPAIPAPGVTVTVSNPGTTDLGYEVLVDGQHYQAGNISAGQTFDQGIVLHDASSEVSITEGTVGADTSTYSLQVDKIVLISGCDAGTVTAVPGPVVTIGAGTCNLNAGTPAIVAPGVFVSLDDSAANAQPADYSIAVNGNTYQGTAIIRAGDTPKSGISLNGSSSVVSVTVNGVVAATKTVVLHCPSADLSLEGPDTATAGKTVKLIGTGPAGHTVGVFFHRPGQAGYSQGRTITISGNGSFSTTYVAAADERYYVAEGNQESSPGLTVIPPAVVSGKITKNVATVAGVAGVTVQLHFHAAGTAASDYSIIRTAPVDAYGVWKYTFALNTDYRFFVTADGYTTPTVLVQRQK